MNLKEIVAPTMKELFISELQSQILSGELKIGERLPTEREMAEKTKISRTVINSALSHMAKLGFVTIIPRKGMFVGDYIKNGNIDTLISIINFNGGKLDKQTFQSLISYRSLNEKECAYLAAQNRNEEDLAHLKDCYEKIKTATSIEEVTDLKLEFHHTIYYASGNTIYALVFNSFKKVVHDYYHVLFNHIGIEEAGIHLKELIDAIEFHKADEAKNIMQELIDIRMDEMSKYYFIE